MTTVTKPTALEPGLLRVFRIYALLRILSTGLIPLLVGREFLSISQYQQFIAAFSFGFALLLFAYLNGSWHQRYLGQAYIPIALLMAIAPLVIEQHFFSSRSISNPFMDILLILIAWQYSFKTVVSFTLGIALLEYGLYLWVPSAIRVPAILGSQADWSIVLGLLVARSATFLMLGYVVSHLVNAQRQHRQALAEANQKLVAHAETLEQLTISRERVRLSRELHDILAHTLSALAVQIEAVLTFAPEIPPRAVATLENMQKTTRTGLDETRRALRALRASPLEEMGLAVALRTYVQDFAARHAIQLDLDLPENLDDLPPDVEQTYYRVAQEALDNAARHSHARRLQVKIYQQNSSLVLQVRDDGAGFVPETGPDGSQLGLQGMRERAELIGARLELDSRPGGGTQVRLLWEAKV